MLSKIDIIENIVGKTDLPKTKVNAIVSEVFKFIDNEVMKNEEVVKIQKFGKFEKKVSNVKKGLDVVTGKEKVIRQNEILKFTGSKK